MSTSHVTAPWMLCCHLKSTHTAALADMSGWSSLRSGSHIAEPCAWCFFETSRMDPPKPRRPLCSWGRDTAQLRAAAPALSAAAGFTGASFLSRGAVMFPNTSDLTLMKHKELTENEHHSRRQIQGVGAAGRSWELPASPLLPRTHRCRVLTVLTVRVTLPPGHHGAGLGPGPLSSPVSLPRPACLSLRAVTSPNAFGGSKSQFK